MKIIIVIFAVSKVSCIFSDFLFRVIISFFFQILKKKNYLFLKMKIHAHCNFIPLILQI